MKYISWLHFALGQDPFSLGLAGPAPEEFGGLSPENQLNLEG